MCGLACRNIRSGGGLRLEVQQEPLTVKTAAIASQAAICTDDAVAWNDQRDRVLAVSQTNGPAGCLAPDLPGKLPIGASLAIRDCLQCRPDPPLERRALGRQRQVEAGQLAREVGHQLLRRGGEWLCIGIAREAECLASGPV